MSTALHAALLTPSGQHAIITPPADGSDRPLVRAAAILAALTAVAMTAYLLVIAAHDVPYVVRARLATLAAVLVVLTGATLITLAALRVQRRQRADDLAALREHLDEQVGDRLEAVAQDRAELLNAVRQQTAASQTAERRLGEIQAGVGQLAEVVGAVHHLRERVEAAEQRVDGTDRDDLLRGIAGWAMQVDQRLAQLQAGAVEGVTVSAQGNGHQNVTDDSGDLPEGVRGYLLGFYDREKDDRG